MKPVLTLAAVLLLGPAAFAQEPPPPPAGPDAAPARLVEPRADELVRKMSDLLAASKAFALEAEEVYDEVPEDLPRIQLTSRRHVALRRPDRLAGTTAGDAVNRSVWYDGHTVSVLDDAQNVYVRMDVPPTIDGAMDTALDRTGMVIPLADFLYSDVYEPPDGERRSAGSTSASTTWPASRATTCPSSRRRSTGSCGSTRARSRCPGSW